MMKQIQTIIIGFFLLAFSFSYAGDFEGVVSQEVYDVNKGTMTMNWFIKGDKIALEVKSGGDSFYFIPVGEQLMMYSSVASEDGNKYYSFIDPSWMSSDLEEINPSLSGVEKMVNDYDCKKVVFNGKTNGSVLFSDRIDISAAKAFRFFQNSYELKALSQLSLNGFPLQSEIYVNGVLSFKTTTFKVDDSNVDESIFMIPNGYVNLPIGE